MAYVNTMTRMGGFFSGTGWNEKEPAGYVNGANLFQFVVDNPGHYSDPAGLDTLEVVRGSDFYLYDRNIDKGISVPIGSDAFDEIYKSHFRWSGSKLEKDPAGADTDESQWWVRVNEGSCETYRINSHITTFMHRLIVSSGEGLDYFESLAKEHEDRVIAFLQKVWGPRVTVDAGQAEQQLQSEYERRTEQFNQLLATIERRDLQTMHSALASVMNENGMIPPRNWWN